MKGEIPPAVKSFFLLFFFPFFCPSIISGWFVAGTLSFPFLLLLHFWASLFYVRKRERDVVRLLRKFLFCLCKKNPPFESEMHIQVRCSSVSLLKGNMWNVCVAHICRHTQIPTTILLLSWTQHCSSLLCSHGTEIGKDFKIAKRYFRDQTDSALWPFPFSLSLSLPLSLVWNLLHFVCLHTQDLRTSHCACERRGGRGTFTWGKNLFSLVPLCWKEKRKKKPFSRRRNSEAGDFFLALPRSLSCVQSIRRLRRRERGKFKSLNMTTRISSSAIFHFLFTRNFWLLRDLRVFSLFS